TMVLRKMKGSTKVHLGGTLRDAVIIIPASFNDFQ
ncbi:hypothetical protein DBR06_SOUSAS3510030, partial [Sousa chinensis]